MTIQNENNTSQITIGATRNLEEEREALLKILHENIAADVKELIITVMALSNKLITIEDTNITTTTKLTKESE